MTAMPSMISTRIFDMPVFCLLPAALSEFSAYVLEVDRLPLHAALRRRDVVGELAGLVDGGGLDAEEVLPILGGRQPLVLAARPFLVGQPVALRIEMDLRIHTD